MVRHLSTPHGTLGTQVYRRENLCSFSPLSTPHGTLGTDLAEVPKFPEEDLSTPHGTLGTNFQNDKRECQGVPFNSNTVH